VVLGRIGQYLDRNTMETQAGFRSGRGTTDNIFVLRHMLEKRHEYRQETLVAFLDYSAAFDSVDRKSLWLILRVCGIPKFYIDLIRSIYEQSGTRIRAYGELGTPFEVRTGVRQGDVLSPLLFIKVVDWVMSKSVTAADGVLMGRDTVISSVEYADDVAIVSDSVAKLQDHITRIEQRSAKLGLQLNSAKCKIIATNPLPTDVLINGSAVEQVDNCGYLGSLVNATGDPEAEINVRIGRASSVYKSLGKTVWKRRQIPLTVKMRILDSMVMPILLYGVEMMPLVASSQRKLESFEHYCLRGILRVGLKDHVRNADLLDRCGRKEPLGDRIRRARMRWLGHIARMPEQRLAYQVFFSGRPDGWKRIGRKRTWRTEVELDLQSATLINSRFPGYSWNGLIVTEAANRVQWRTFSAKRAK
jgi:hypothetical protein